MEKYKSPEEIEKERAKYPFGRPPYTPHHKNHLPPGFDPFAANLKPSHTPNSIPFETRRFNILCALFLFVYGTIGLYLDDLYIPGKRGRGAHLHGVPAWIMYGALLCACLVLISEVIDHYDTRNNEHLYHRFAIFFKYLGWAFFAASWVVMLFGAP